MKYEEFDHQESSTLINFMIGQAREKFAENWIIYMLWGLLTSMSSTAQFLLLQSHYHHLHYYPYFTLPCAALFTWYYYYSKRKSDAMNLVSRSVSMVWFLLSINIMVLIFWFSGILKYQLIPILTLLLSFGIIISGVTLRSWVLVIAGVLVNILGFGSYWIDWLYHPLVMTAVGVVGIFLPGLFFMIGWERKINIARY